MNTTELIELVNGLDDADAPPPGSPPGVPMSVWKGWAEAVRAKLDRAEAALIERDRTIAELQAELDYAKGRRR